MVRIARKSDGRRIFTAEFKREQIGRVLRGELTLAELSRKLGIARGLLQRWKRLMTQGSETAVAAHPIVLPATKLQAAEEHIRELQRLVGKQTVELEALRAALDVARSGQRLKRAPKR
ncbi:MAG: transposase [Acidobacteriota bacterium]